MAGYEERLYRQRCKSRGLVSFTVRVKETDLWIAADSDLTSQAVEFIQRHRRGVENYISNHPGFLEALTPWPDDPLAPPLVRAMIAASQAVGSGPMAAVAGAIAQIVGQDLLDLSDRVVVENGGDLFLAADRDLTVAVDALGAEKVEALMMPSRYTADISQIDAEAEAETLGVHYRVIPIEPAFDTFNEMLSEEFAGMERDATEENIQARTRGILVMAISNKRGRMVLTTGNKSEMAVGYATLYGDMAGGFAPLKDVPKTLVYRLARWRNEQSPAIPERVITRPPSAELAPDQKDEDSLPPYEVLDDILECLVEDELRVAEVVARGHDLTTVRRVEHLLYIAIAQREPGV